MRQTHVGGEKLFVDYAGDTVPIVDRLTGEVRGAQIFVAVMGASNFIYAEARWTQSLADWIGAHTRVALQPESELGSLSRRSYSGNPPRRNAAE
jgi:transposase